MRGFCFTRCQPEDRLREALASTSTRGRERGGKGGEGKGAKKWARTPKLAGDPEDPGENPEDSTHWEYCGEELRARGLPPKGKTGAMLIAPFQSLPGMNIQKGGRQAREKPPREGEAPKGRARGAGTLRNRRDC